MMLSFIGEIKMRKNLLRLILQTAALLLPLTAPAATLNAEARAASREQAQTLLRGE